ncbi:hypothetical protein P021_gp54 [Pelagibacter phage HTVC021P]|nr:hypothetical protein P021_gp54 [Pelagibacter phage HTVC021P]
MIDRIAFFLFGLLDKFSEHLDKVFFPKKCKCKDKGKCQCK